MYPQILLNMSDCVSRMPDFSVFWWHWTRSITRYRWSRAQIRQTDPGRIEGGSKRSVATSAHRSGVIHDVNVRKNPFLEGHPYETERPSPVGAARLVAVSASPSTDAAGTSFSWAAALSGILSDGFVTFADSPIYGPPLRVLLAAPAKTVTSSTKVQVGIRITINFDILNS